MVVIKFLVSFRSTNHLPDGCVKIHRSLRLRAFIVFVHSRHYVAASQVAMQGLGCPREGVFRGGHRASDTLIAKGFFVMGVQTVALIERAQPIDSRSAWLERLNTLGGFVPQKQFR